MYPWSFLYEGAKIKRLSIKHKSSILSQRKNFVKAVRKQYGNPDSHAIFYIFSQIFIFIKKKLLAIDTNNNWIV